MAASSFPEFITSRRRELDLTLGEVATSLGVSPITVSNWSNGQSTPEPENLRALAEILEVPADDLAAMAGVSLKPVPGAAVNLMADDGDSETDVDAEAEALAEDSELDEPVAADSDDEAPIDDEVPIPAVELDPLTGEVAAVPDALDSELADLIEGDAPDGDTAPDSVPAFVEAAPASTPAAATRRRPAARRPRRDPQVAERQVTVLPLTYIEDPKQLMRYRIRWALTVAVLLVMFIILLWASRELISALSEVKEAVTPGGVGS